MNPTADELQLSLRMIIAARYREQQNAQHIKFQTKNSPSLIASHDSYLLHITSFHHTTPLRVFVAEVEPRSISHDICVIAVAINSVKQPAVIKSLARGKKESQGLSPKGVCCCCINIKCKWRSA